jgi:predicted acetyltransferase
MPYGEKIRIMKNIILKPATLNDYPTLQNMARFYVYDLSRTCGFISDEWNIPHNGLYESFDFKRYFDEKNRHPFLVYIGNELAGFALIQKKEKIWSMEEFFILAKFQGKGVGKEIAHQLWTQYPGFWEISVIPENKPALSFWHQCILTFGCKATFTEETVDFDLHQPKRLFFRFDTKKQKLLQKNTSIQQALDSHIPFMVGLSYAKRKLYEKEQPQFWRYAGESAEKSQEKWFQALQNQPDFHLLVALSNNQIIGFIIGQLVKAPDVYDPGGLTLMVDDFCVQNEIDWFFVGKNLLIELETWAHKNGSVQTVVICGTHDIMKKYFLEKAGFSTASNWYVKEHS